MFKSGDIKYREWRAAKMDTYPASAGDITVGIGGLCDLDDAQLSAILLSCRRANMAVYSCLDSEVDRDAVREFAARFGLSNLDHHLCANEDGIAELTVTETGRRGEYVPYSSRSLSWHTDGYYHDASRRLQAVILHCAQDAQAGGESAVLDPDIAYIKLRDADPAFIAAFEHPHCMTIPANTGEAGEIRAEVSGPVFSYDNRGAVLHMRYSTRRKNIAWRDDAATAAAREFLTVMLADEKGPVLRFRLKPGQGLISNNVLHNRTAFVDNPVRKRLFYRARFFDRIHSS